MKKIRLDDLLVLKNKVATKSKAQALIFLGIVVDQNQMPLTKAGLLVPVDFKFSLKEQMPFVSRGGLKLAGALKEFKINVAQLDCIDVGSSTGGFTDCLLQNNAKNVTCVDVGTNQLVYKLYHHPKTHVMEQYNFRYAKKEDFPGLYDFACVDVSFISLKLILPVLINLLKPQAQIICLIKPQFEAAKQDVKKGFVNAATANKVVTEIIAFAGSLNLKNNGLMKSPILGNKKKNQEFLAYFSMS